MEATDTQNGHSNKSEALQEGTHISSEAKDVTLTEAREGEGEQQQSVGNRAIRRLSNGDVKRRSSSSRSSKGPKLDTRDKEDLPDRGDLPEVQSPPSRSHSSGSRSRSRSQDRNGGPREKKDKSKMTEEELRQERELKKMKKKLRKQKKRPYRDTVSDPQVINNIRKAITEDTHIPDQLKDKFIAIEINPLCLCIANPPYNSVSQGLQHYFNTLLKDLYPEYAQNRKDPVRRVELADTKKYCVLYMQDDEIAEELLDMGPLEYQTTSLKIERAKGFFTKIYRFMDEDERYDQALFLQEHKLYMGNLPTYLTEDEIRKLVENIGPIKYFNLVRDTAANGALISRGFCFFEFADPRITEKAIKSLNGLEIGEKRIRVSRVENDTSKQDLPKDKKEPTFKAPSASSSLLSNFPELEDPLIQAMLNIPQSCRLPSRVVMFLNMASAEDLLDDEFYFNLVDDVQQECLVFGSIDKIEIPRPHRSTGICCSSVGKVFVKFHYERPAKQARYKLNGRTYNGRTVIASFFSEEDFQKKEYLSCNVEELMRNLS